MAIRIIKVVGSKDQGDLKFGSSRNQSVKEHKRLVREGILPPKGLLLHLRPSQESYKHETLIGMGKVTEAMDLMGYTGYLKFQKVESGELGFIDPTYRTALIKVSNIVHNPELSSQTEFVEGINWLYDHLERYRGKGAVANNTNIYLLSKSMIPTKMTRPLTLEDIVDEVKPNVTG